MVRRDEPGVWACGLGNGPWREPYLRGTIVSVRARPLWAGPGGGGVLCCSSGCGWALPVRARMHACMLASKHTCVCTRAAVCMCVCKRACERARLRVCVCAHACTQESMRSVKHKTAVCGQWRCVRASRAGRCEHDPLWRGPPVPWRILVPSYDGRGPLATYPGANGSWAATGRNWFSMGLIWAMLAECSQ